MAAIHGNRYVHVFQTHAIQEMVHRVGKQNHLSQKKDPYDEAPDFDDSEDEGKEPEDEDPEGKDSEGDNPEGDSPEGEEKMTIQKVKI